MLRIIEIPYGGELYHAQLGVRRDELRRPLGMDYTEEYLAAEKNDIFLAAMDGDAVVGSLALARISATEVRFRQIATAKSHQGRGIGLKLVHAAELLAKKQGYQNVIINSREAVVGFYEKAGYRVASEPFMEVGIPHIRMEKSL